MTKAEEHEQEAEATVDTEHDSHGCATDHGDWHPAQYDDSVFPS